MSANTISLPRGLVDDLARALKNTTTQLEILIDPGVVTHQVYSHACGVLATFHDTLDGAGAQTGENAHPQAAYTYPADTLDHTLESFGGPLRLAVMCLERADEDDLETLNRLHTLDLATACDDWKSRAETRMIRFETSGPEQSGTG